MGAPPRKEGWKAAYPAAAKGRDDARVRSVFRAESINLDSDIELAPKLSCDALDKLEGAAARGCRRYALGRRW